MAKDPAFLFYTGDFSTGTQFFTDEQVGKYIRLLLAQHQLGHLHENHMFKICKTHDKDVFDKFIKDENGLYFNQRLEIEILKRKSYSKSRSDNRKDKTKNSDISSTYVLHMENENKDVLSNADNSTISGKIKIQENMIVVEMIKVWKIHNPMYLEDKENDYAACLQMAYKIAKVKGWKESDVIDFKKVQAIDSWEKIMAFVSSDNFLKDFPLKNLNNNFQMVVQKIQGKKKEVKENSELNTTIVPMTEKEKGIAIENWVNNKNEY